MKFDGEKPGPRRYFTISNVVWKLPKNAAEIVNSVRWLAQEELPVRGSGPPFLAAHPVKFSTRDGVVRFMAPEVKVYAFAAVSW